MRWRLPAACAALPVLLAACASPAPAPPSSSSPSATPPRSATPAKRPVHRDGISPEPYAQPEDAPPSAGEIPPDLDLIPDAVPRSEPRSRSGNSPVYTVLGKTYRVLADAEGFSERGRASWYGKKFQGRTTASGEPYDMFKMTAAHKTLPLPSYVRVTNLDNDRSVIVKVNDRGPFHPGRVIDLSYAAANRLDIIHHGHAEVKVELVQPGEDVAPPPTFAQQEGWLQIGLYFDPINAIALREELRERRFVNVQVRADEEDGESVHRVLVGPYASRQEAEEAHQRLRNSGYEASWSTL